MRRLHAPFVVVVALTSCSAEEPATTSDTGVDTGDPCSPYPRDGEPCATTDTCSYGHCNTTAIESSAQCVSGKWRVFTTSCNPPFDSGTWGDTGAVDGLQPEVEIGGDADGRVEEASTDTADGG